MSKAKDESKSSITVTLPIPNLGTEDFNEIVKALPQRKMFTTYEEYCAANIVYWHCKGIKYVAEKDVKAENKRKDIEATALKVKKMLADPAMAAIYKKALETEGK